VQILGGLLENAAVRRGVYKLVYCPGTERILLRLAGRITFRLRADL
jgi:hypothetical protein